MAVQCVTCHGHLHRPKATVTNNRKTSKPGFNCPAALGNLQGGAAHKTHTQSISHTPIQQKANAAASHCLTMAAEGGSALPCSTSK